MSDINPYLEVARLVAASICGALSGALVAHKLTISREQDAEKRAARQKLVATILRLLLDMQHEGDLTGLRYNRKPELTSAIATFSVFQCQTVRDGLQAHLKKYEEIPPSALAAKIESAPDGSNVIGRSQAVSILSEPLKEMLQYVDAV